MLCTVLERRGTEASHEHECHFALLELGTGSVRAGASQGDSCQFDH